MEPRTLPEIIENSSERNPEGIAFKCGNDAISYKDFEVKMNQLANHLRKSEFQKGDRVGIYMNRCIESAIAVFGIMQAGGVYVPLDPSNPVTRILFLLEDCGIEHLVTTPNQHKKMDKIGTMQTSLKSVIGWKESSSLDCISWEALYSSLEITKPTLDINEHDLAYIMYTSGSTGAPKGIMHTHYSGLNYARMSAKLYEVNETDIFANHAPLHFDISTFGYFTIPLAGATTVIIPDAYTKLPASLSDLMEKEKISIWYSVPLALIQLLTNGVIDQKELNSLRFVLFGGEVFPPKYLRDLMKLWPNAIFSNVYGPAEVNQCTIYNLHGIPGEDENIPIGKAVNNVSLKIVDQVGKEVARGKSGELLVKTNTMMQSYWNNPGLNEMAFYDEYDNRGSLNRYYRTGDIVKEDQNGNIFFVGRDDKQVKIRGYRVELDEIEAVINRCEIVKECAVVLLQEGEIKKIAAAVLVKDGMDTAITDLRAHCRSELPSYAVPERIDFLPSLPRTSSGKINRIEIKNSLMPN